MKEFYTRDLDGTHALLTELNNLSTKDGMSLEGKIKNVITNLQKHWKGNDATVHINNLIDIYTGLNKIINCINIIAHDNSLPIVKAQTFRNVNGGGGEVGNIIPVSEDELYPFVKLDNTAEYFVDPTGAPQDYNELAEAGDLFSNFCNKLYEYKEELFEKWESGDDRDRALSTFEEFESNVDKYKANLNKAKGNLGNATARLKDINIGV